MVLGKEKINRSMEENRHPIPRKVDLHKCNQLIFDRQKFNSVEIGKFLNKSCWSNWKSICKEMNLDTDLTPYTRTNSKSTIDLNVKFKTIKLL